MESTDSSTIQESTTHEITSQVHVGVVLFPQRYSTEISHVERRKTPKIIIIKTFNTLFLADMVIHIINKKITYIV